MDLDVVAEPEPANPFAMRGYVFTVVTPDLEDSTRFYRDLMGNEVIAEGALSGDLPTMAGVGAPGRRWRLLRHKQKGIGERGVIRLLEAPAGAAANRPRPDTPFMAPGACVIECHASDYDEAHAFLTANGVKTVSKPQYYFKGDPDKPYYSTTSFSAFGPAGEQFLISCQNLPNVYRQRKPVEFPGLLGPITAHSMMCYSRWPVWKFYEDVFGLTCVLDRVFQTAPINILCGLPVDGYYIHSMPGSNMRMEVWEFLQYGPPPEPPPYPTSLDKTGFAMTTMLVDDLALVRARAEAAGVAILGEGALPTPEGPSRDGFYIRGAVGELLEIIGRS